MITPAFNFVADHQAIVATGAAPVLCDVEDATLGLDPDKVAALVGPRTKAIVPLHFGGVAGRVKELYAVAERHRLRIVEDATHAFGTRVDGRPIGSFGDVTCFSFDPVKVITSIDGGAVIVGDDGDIDRLRHWRFLGIDRETLARYQNSRAWEYDVVSQGFRYHLTNINAAVGALAAGARRRVHRGAGARSCRLYSRAPGGRWTACARPATDFEDVSPFIYTVRVPPARREPLIDHLRSRGIATGIHFLPAQDFSFLKALPARRPERHRARHARDHHPAAAHADAVPDRRAGGERPSASSSGRRERRQRALHRRGRLGRRAPAVRRRAQPPTPSTARCCCVASRRPTSSRASGRRPPR